jgi:hypothetical protein
MYVSVAELIAPAVFCVVVDFVEQAVVTCEAMVVPSVHPFFAYLGRLTVS